MKDEVIYLLRVVDYSAAGILKPVKEDVKSFPEKRKALQEFKKARERLGFTTRDVTRTYVPTLHMRCGSYSVHKRVVALEEVFLEE